MCCRSWAGAGKRLLCLWAVLRHRLAHAEPLVLIKLLCRVAGSPGKRLMGVHIHAIDETRSPHTKQGKRQRGRAYPTWHAASMEARLKRNAHYGVLLPMCVVGYPPDWVLMAGIGYCAALEGALSFYLQRTACDMIGNTAVVRKDKTQ